jgi:hypothetical protein
VEPSDAFFAGSRYAVFGARARGRCHGPVLIAALRKAGKQAVAIEPDGCVVKGAETARSLAASGEVAGAVLLPPAPWNETAADLTADAVRQCAERGVPLWIYTVGKPDAAVAIACGKGVDPVPGPCPCLYVVGGGFPHGFHRWMLKVTKRM